MIVADPHADLAGALRRIADTAWEAGFKDICTRVHDIAREVEGLASHGCTEQRESLAA